MQSAALSLSIKTMWRMGEVGKNGAGLLVSLRVGSSPCEKEKTQKVGAK
jgi:hypothetical protein